MCRSFELFDYYLRVINPKMPSFVHLFGRSFGSCRISYFSFPSFHIRYSLCLTRIEEPVPVPFLTRSPILATQCYLSYVRFFLFVISLFS